MTEKHTPGPWLIASGTSVYALNDSGFNCFYAQVQDAHTSREELEANAKLIAAAPDLLEFAKLIVNGEGHSLREIMQQGKAAIAKATGETKCEDMNTKIDWGKHRFGNGVLCEFRPRETYQGRPLRPPLARKAGTQFVLVAMWKMDEDDPYPGEYALSTKSCAQLLAELGLTWIASGDVVVIGESTGAKT